MLKSIVYLMMMTGFSLQRMPSSVLSDPVGDASLKPLTLRFADTQFSDSSALI